MPEQKKHPELTQRTLGELSNLKCEYFTCPVPDQDYGEILVVRFVGDCGYGSGSNCDCVFMSAMVKAGLQAFEPFALVLDFVNLAYEWGDMMVAVLAAGQGQYIDAEFPTAVVMSDKNREGLTSLVEKEMMAKPVDWLFESLPEAIDGIVRKRMALKKNKVN